MRVKILKPIAELVDGSFKEFRIDEIIELEGERAEALSKSGLVEIIVEKALDEPPEDKMIKKAGKKKGI